MHMRVPRDPNHCALDPCPQLALKSEAPWLERKVVLGKDAAVSAGRLEVNEIAGSRPSHSVGIIKRLVYIESPCCQY